MFIGIDEVGRGPLAGPVTVGGVILSPIFPVFTFEYLHKSSEKMKPVDKVWQLEFYQKYPAFQAIKDSKRVSEKKREKLVQMLIDTLPKLNSSYYVLSCPAKLIDEFGVGKCISYLTMLLILELENFDTFSTLSKPEKAEKAENKTKNTESKIYLDGNIKIYEQIDYQFLKALNHPKRLEYFQTKYEIQKENKSDDKYLSVAMASILAKVNRDNYMSELAKKFPEYDWSQNKGYGTLKHRKAISHNPHNPHLRKSFCKNIQPV